MKKLLVVLASAACLVFGSTGCHKKPAASAKFLEFTITPNAANKSVDVECIASSSDKCGLLFVTTPPSEAISLAVGSKTTVPGVTAGMMYCSGTVAPLLAKCKQSPVPDKADHVRRDQKAAAAKPSDN